jgi:hypothetical protein
MERNVQAEGELRARASALLRAPPTDASTLATAVTADGDDAAGAEAAALLAKASLRMTWRIRISSLNSERKEPPRLLAKANERTIACTRALELSCGDMAEEHEMLTRKVTRCGVMWHSWSIV